MILDEIVEVKLKQLQKEKQYINLEEMEKRAYDTVISKRDFKGALNKSGMSIIAEIKKASPSKGLILEDFNVSRIASVYEKLKVDAVSILTEKKYFLGNDAYILDAKKVCSKPVLRKDFIVDQYQLYQARAIGADAVLLIAAVLKDKLKYFYEKTVELGLDSITEIHSEEEARLAVASGCKVIGINNRDLTNFTTDLKTTERLIKHIPKDTVIVSESAIKTSEDINYLASLGVDAVLVGETFMRHISEESFLEEFLTQAKI